MFSRTDPVSSAETGVHYAEERVKQCERFLATQKQNRETAKKNGNYKSTCKNYRSGTKVGTVYDSNVWVAEGHLREAKDTLAQAKRKLTEAKRDQKAYICK